MIAGSFSVISERGKKIKEGEKYPVENVACQIK